MQVTTSVSANNSVVTICKVIINIMQLSCMQIDSDIVYSLFTTSYGAIAPSHNIRSQTTLKLSM